MFGGECHYPFVTIVLGTLKQGAVPISLPRQGDDITSLLPCGLAVLGKARVVNPNRKSGAGVPEAVWQVNATPETPATLLAPKQYRHSSIPWIHRPRGEGRLAAWTAAVLPYTLPRLCSSTGEDTPALIHRPRQTEGCRRRVKMMSRIEFVNLIQRVFRNFLLKVSHYSNTASLT